MNMRVIMGILLFLLGALAFIGFFKVATSSAQDILDDKDDDGNFKSYDPGDQVLISGELEKVYDIGYWTALGLIGLSNQTACDMDVDSTEEFYFIIDGQHASEIDTGDDIWAFLELRKSEGLLADIEYWSVENTDSIHSVMVAQAGFAGMALLGIMLATWGFASKGRK